MVTYILRTTDWKHDYEHPVSQMEHKSFLLGLESSYHTPMEVHEKSPWKPEIRSLWRILSERWGSEVPPRIIKIWYKSSNIWTTNAFIAMILSVSVHKIVFHHFLKTGGATCIFLISTNFFPILRPSDEMLTGHKSWPLDLGTSYCTFRETLDQSSWKAEIRSQLQTLFEPPPLPQNI